MKINQVTLFRLFVLPILLSVASLCVSGQSKRPNIIFILADDLGIGNVSAYGSDNFKTPNIDKLAQGGVRFEHTYAAPLCGPSRAMLMTGRYAFRTGMTGNDSGPLIKPANEIMVPKLLKSAGYVSAQVGKWSQLPLEPGDFGFDEYLRFKGSGTYWNTQRRGRTYTLNGKEIPLADGEYLPDLMHNFLVDFMTRHKDAPFYAYYSMSHIHAEIMPTPDSEPGSRDLYGDNITYLDKLVGKLVSELERLKLREKTLIIFVGDNGTVRGQSMRSTIRGKRISGSKGSMLEGGSLVPMIANWPGTTPAGKVLPDLLDFSDFYPTIAELAGAKLPKGVTIDGKSFLSQLRGKRGAPRDWIYVQLGTRWYVRDRDWKLNEGDNLFDMTGAPFVEKPIAADSSDATSLTARKRLQAVIDKLNPGGGIVDPGNGSGKRADRAKRRGK